MPAGLQVFDASSNILLDLTDRASRIVGVVFIAGNASGSVFVDPSQGTPWAVPWPRSFPIGSAHKITINPSTGQIDYAPNTSVAGLQVDADLFYGVY